MEYLLSLLVMAGIYVTLAASFNLIIGYAGLMSIAHPIYFACGAYTTALLALHTGMPPLLAIPAGGVAALAFSALLSLPALRVSGDYLLVTSIGIQLGVLEILKNLDAVGGASGLSNIPNAIEGPARSAGFAAIALPLALAAVLLVRWLVRGPYGRAIAAMRDDELAFQALGRDPVRIKVSVFAIGSGIAGLAGGLYACYVQFLSPEQFTILESSTILTMVVVGGMGSVWGPAVGALVLLGLPQLITFLNLPPSVMAPLQGMIYSALVILFLFLRPRGLAGGADAR